MEAESASRPSAPYGRSEQSVDSTVISEPDAIIIAECRFGTTEGTCSKNLSTNGCRESDAGVTDVAALGALHHSNFGIGT
jgi:hypothetical protein